MKLLNLGCGQCYNINWINIDFQSHAEGIIAHDLTTGIPFEDLSFDVVYHSHVLEHFSKEQGNKFIKECYRVLKPGGIIRIAVPDLESIVKEYLHQLDKVRNGDSFANNNYNWILLELFDQMVRSSSGGEMVKTLKQIELVNENYIFNRLGQEATNLRNDLKNKKFQKTNTTNKSSIRKSISYFRRVTIPKYKSKSAFKLASLLVNDKSLYAKYTIGNFRNGGEPHLWMYDSYSLGNLLKTSGFKNIIKQSFNTSYLIDWKDYSLDSDSNGNVRKPDSLFMEAVK